MTSTRHDEQTPTGEPGTSCEQSCGPTGPWGRSVRAIAGAGLVVWALVPSHAHPWLDVPGAGSRAWGVLAGAVAVPAVITGALALRGPGARRVSTGAGAGVVVLLLVLVLAQVFPVAVMVAIGSGLLLLAGRGVGGCEIFAVPNLVLSRDDYLFCLPFTPIDEWERRRGLRRRP